MQDTKSPPRIAIDNWKPYCKNTLRGFFSATLPSGLVIHELMLHEKNGKRWIGLPAKEWRDAENQKRYTPILEFRDDFNRDRFRDQVLVAVDEYLFGRES